MEHLHVAPTRTPLSASFQRLRTYAQAPIRVFPDGPLYDETAQALALGAAACVESTQSWNSLAVDDTSPYETRVFLAQHGINSVDTWAAMVGEALGPDGGGDVDMVLGVRAIMMRGGETITNRMWRAEMHGWLRSGDQSQADHDAVDAIIDIVDVIDDAIVDAGVVEPGIRVRSIAGHRIGWAVTIARWGAHSGYGDPAAVRQTLLAARDAAAAHFVDWNEFAASLLMGVALTRDDYRTGFDSALSSVATLLTALDSPWRNLAFPSGTDSPI